MFNFKKKQKIILIGGSPRSGTTLLQGMICDGNKVNPLMPEVSYLLDLLEINRRWNTYGDKKSSLYFGSVEKMKSFCRVAVEKFITGIPFINKYEFVCLKDPLLANYVEEIISIFSSEVMLILMIRDPRDVIASMISVEKRKIEIEGDEYKQIMSFDDIVEFIYQFFYNIMNYKGSNVFVLKYENLVLGKTEEVNEFLGMVINEKPYGSSMLDFSLEKQTNPFITDKYTKSDVMDDSLGAYKKILTADQIKKINIVFSGVMEYFNYDI